MTNMMGARFGRSAGCGAQEKEQKNTINNSISAVMVDVIWWNELNTFPRWLPMCIYVYIYTYIIYIYTRMYTYYMYVNKFNIYVYICTVNTYEACSK
jgi:hypothetical protein